MSVPRSTRHAMIGSSQNFFRSFMKSHISRINSPIAEISSPSELVFHMRGRPGASRETITLPFCIKTSSHGVSSQETHDVCHRREQQKIYYTKQNPCVEYSYYAAQRHPEQIRAPQNGRIHQCRNGEYDCSGHSPDSGWCSMPEHRIDARRNEENGHDDAERPELFLCCRNSVNVLSQARIPFSSRDRRSGVSAHLCRRYSLPGPGCPSRCA
jgi:hypothetical protein